MNTIATIVRADRILLMVDGSEVSFPINEFRSREQATREAEAYCKGFAEGARIMGNQFHSVMDQALRKKIE